MVLFAVERDVKISTTAFKAGYSVIHFNVSLVSAHEVLHGDEEVKELQKNSCGKLALRFKPVMLQ